MGETVHRLVPGEMFAGCRIESLAGHGGMGLVYRARQLVPDRIVAVKVLAPELANHGRFRARFEREARLIVELEHPNVIPVYDVGEEDDRLYIVMRFVETMDLGRLLRNNGRFEARDAVRLTSQIASALDAAHERRLVHRDVKPANVLVVGAAPDEHLYLTDFGLTKRVGDVGPGLTATGGFVGSLDYIAPEQATGGAVDARADIYALGCVLYQLLTGAVPFPAEYGAAKVNAHLTAPAPVASHAVPGVTGNLDAVIARALAKDPTERFQSAGELARAAAVAAVQLSESAIERAAGTTADVSVGETGGRGDAPDGGVIDEEEIPLHLRHGNVSQTAGKSIYNGPIDVEGDFIG